MSGYRLDAETANAALSLATRAPSVHNSQPWHWRVGPHSVHLFAERSLQLEHTDPDGRDLVVSCGIALNHCTVALAALGWQAKIHRLPNPEEPDHLASLELHRSPAGETDISLASAIPRRRTDRRHFSAWPVPPGHVAMMGARAARMGVTMRRIDPDEDFRAILERARRRHGEDAGYLSELAAWSGRYGAVAGVPARNTPEPDPAAQVPGRIFAGAALSQPEDSTAADDHGVVLALGTAADDAVARLRAGEATSQILLTATSMGLASCIFTEPLELPETRDQLQAKVFSGSHFPQVLLRIGWLPPNADPLPATPRRAIGDVAGRLDGEPLD
ncbi:nitroreductase [Mycolicibacterium canariasense]|uniref:Nitroreductase n=1 Tax=Mycolicibacterium canariasense TaxID=228230 RepID=A0A100W8S3_MYCCR|nr:nitroreductase family protein [Mycolicibacterium canariasense]MCV7213364.1 nitroreductase family protein [Mycolicibacterium canariasense]ORV10607.1 NAD(P)H nitroreductase [Mycolicibacterium canariasense]GAS93594.1 nitroreductase [Mycolicibacterium canariasense]